MSDKKDERPPVGTPEFKAWLKKQTAKDFEDIFSAGTAEFENGGAIFGDLENLEKSDAELFPDELEEYTPEERRKAFKVHQNKDSKEEG